MNATASASPAPQPRSLIGTWRRFGPFGPVYEIVAIGGTTSQGHATMRVRVIETGEEIEYRLADILDDPRER
ncbi:DUF5397 family protein [Methylobacterium oryzihabitans]|uniref:Uncharacterized protein n=1 Tax=Methylobacterium oryzihabitans TaxID=2499852 RepID=A0A437P5B7_9HYPH|nr:DUF5397 family protein [Methylobacterium oryzihabitans]RVU17424.1 hypothetical protein EOE48_13605 [Methylobacterium oryzihabitans]